MIIYIAGKYNGTSEEIDSHIAIAQETAKELWQKGYYAICPHLNTAHFGGIGVDDRVFLDGYLCIMEKCDAVVLLPNWKESHGARVERERALLQGIPVFDSVKALCNFGRTERKTKNSTVKELEAQVDDLADEIKKYDRQNYDLETEIEALQDEISRLERELEKEMYK